MIGGGATGLGTAVDAATRGYRTLLLEARRLRQGDVEPEHEADPRRRPLPRSGAASGSSARRSASASGCSANAPHLVHDRAVPRPGLCAGGSGRITGSGSGSTTGSPGGSGRGRSRAVGRDEALRLAPTLEPNGLRGGVVYHDGQFDDARLAIALVRTIDDHGGTALNRVRVDGLVEGRRRPGRRASAPATPRPARSSRSRRRAVVNATGVFADEVRRLDEPGAPRR